MLFIFIAIAVLLVITAVLVIMKKYKKELIAQNWYDEFQYEFQSVDCPHALHFKLAETDWKFAFTPKKEKNFTVRAGPFAKTTHQVHYRFYCKECERKCWFEQTNSVQDHKGLFTLRLKYLAIGFATIMLLFIISMNIIFRIIL